MVYEPSFSLQKVHFRALFRGTGSEHCRKATTTLGEQRGEGCGEHRTVAFDRKPILVPSCPPTGLDGCNIMTIEYYVKVKIFMILACISKSYFVFINLATV